MAQTLQHNFTINNAKFIQARHRKLEILKQICTPVVCANFHGTLFLNAFIFSLTPNSYFVLFPVTEQF